MKWSNLALAVVAALFVSTVSAETTIVETPIITAVESSDSIDKFLTLSKFLTKGQAEVLASAYSIAKEDGHKYPQLLQGIVLQESNAGNTRASLSAHGNYGVAQIKLVAAKDVLARYPYLRDQFKVKTDKDIINQLVDNNVFNLTVASKYLLILRQYGFDTIRQLALAYNQGPGGAKTKNPRTFHYSNGVVRHIQSLEKT